jgi:hypothetical protein
MATPDASAFAGVELAESEIIGEENLEARRAPLTHRNSSPETRRFPMSATIHIVLMSGLAVESRCSTVLIQNT